MKKEADDREKLAKRDGALYVTKVNNVQILLTDAVYRGKDNQPKKKGWA